MRYGHLLLAASALALASCSPSRQQDRADTGAVATRYSASHPEPGLLWDRWDIGPAVLLDDGGILACASLNQRLSGAVGASTDCLEGGQVNFTVHRPVKVASLQEVARMWLGPEWRAVGIGPGHSPSGMVVPGTFVLYSKRVAPPTVEPTAGVGATATQCASRHMTRDAVRLVGESARTMCHDFGVRWFHAPGRTVTINGQPILRDSDVSDACNTGAKAYDIRACSS